MSLIVMPTDLSLTTMNWAQVRQDVEARSNFAAQASELGTPLWAVTLGGPNTYDADPRTGAWQALILQLRGRTNQLSVFNTVRAVPRGTMRGSITFNAAPAAGDATLNITAGAGQAGTTLLQGDYLGFGSGLTQQMIMVTANATANGSGVIAALSYEPVIRNAFLLGDPIIWDHPRIAMRRRDSMNGWDYTGITVSGFGLELLEDWRP